MGPGAEFVAIVPPGEGSEAGDGEGNEAVVVGTGADCCHDGDNTNETLMKHVIEEQ